MKMIDTYAEKQMIERTDEMEESAQAGPCVLRMIWISADNLIRTAITLKF